MSAAETMAILSFAISEVKEVRAWLLQRTLLADSIQGRILHSEAYAVLLNQLILLSQGDLDSHCYDSSSSIPITTGSTVV